MDMYHVKNAHFSIFNFQDPTGSVQRQLRTGQMEAKPSSTVNKWSSITNLWLFCTSINRFEVNDFQWELDTITYRSLILREW